MATKRRNRRETLIQKGVFGSLIGEEFEPDRLADVIEWLQARLAEVPPEFRDTTRIEVESLGGYEGEHHTEIEVYYERPETDDEMQRRLADMRQQATLDEARLLLRLEEMQRTRWALEQ